jgi:hypothetical protein
MPVIRTKKGEPSGKLAIAIYDNYDIGLSLATDNLYNSHSCLLGG